MDKRNDNMDNFGVHVTARDPETFKAAFRLAFNPPGRKATHYKFDKIPKSELGEAHTIGMMQSKANGMILYGAMESGSTRLPYEMDVEQALVFAEGWLKHAAYEPQPDHDGDNVKGFQITTGNFWGHVNGSHCSILAIMPCWALLGK